MIRCWIQKLAICYLNDTGGNHLPVAPSLIKHDLRLGDNDDLPSGLDILY